MLIILKKRTRKVVNNLGTNSLFPDGHLPIEETGDKIYVRLHNESDFAKQILSAYNYELELDVNNELINVIVHKTLDEFVSEQPIPPKQKTEIEILKEQI